jgi:hypothetical protein
MKNKSLHDFLLGTYVPETPFHSAKCAKVLGILESDFPHHQ